MIWVRHRGEPSGPSALITPLYCEEVFRFDRRLRLATDAMFKVGNSAVERDLVLKRDLLQVVIAAIPILKLHHVPLKGNPLAVDICDSMDMIAARYHRVPTMGTNLPVEALVDDGHKITGRRNQSN